MRHWKLQLHRLKRLERTLGRPGDPKHWCFYLIEDEQIPDFIQVQIAEQDTVFIRQYMIGLLALEQDRKITGEFEPSIGNVTKSDGSVTCLYRSGKTLEVQSDRYRYSRNRRRL